MYLLMFILGTVCLSFLLFVSIQQGQWLGFWQGVLYNMRNSRNKWARHLAKPLGDCEVCYCHAVAFISFWVLFITPLYSLAWWAWVFIYFFYVPVTTVLSLLLLKRFQK